MLIYCKIIKIKNIYIYLVSSIFNFTNEYRNFPISIFSKTKTRIKKFRSIFFNLFLKKKKKRKNPIVSIFTRHSQSRIPVHLVPQLRRNRIRIDRLKRQEKFHGMMKLRHGFVETRARKPGTESRVSTICIRAAVCVRSSGRQTGKYLRRTRPQIRICRFAPVTSCTRKQTIPSAGKRLVLLYSFGARATSE